ncbi:MAG TPA: DUF5615 family PIN-like protein [Thermomicrobiales bacterium]|jgi:predicted nuclease of predicted toxin-antitoxin system
MRGYLLDENLPGRLLSATQWPFFHAREFGASLTDMQLWLLAARNEWAIVSKDADFAERIMVTQPPPWVVHIKVGNLRLADFRDLIANRWPEVEALLPEYKLINLYHDRIEAVSDQQ